MEFLTKNYHLLNRQLNGIFILFKKRRCFIVLSPNKRVVKLLLMRIKFRHHQEQDSDVDCNICLDRNRMFVHETLYKNYVSWIC